MNNPFKKAKASATPGVQLPGTAGNLNNRNPKAAAKAPVYIILLKIVSILIFFGAIFLSVFLKFDLDPGNQYLQALGYDQNTFTKESALRKDFEQNEIDKLRYIEERNKFQKKLKIKEYSQNTKALEAVEGQQIIWFDSFDAKGEFHIGLFDLPNHLGEFISIGLEELRIRNDDALNLFSFPIGEKNVKIEGIQVSRNSINFSFEADNSNRGKVFTLTNEFIKFINGSPDLSGVNISSFVRQKNQEGYDSMRLGVSAKRQLNTKDPKDSPQQYDVFNKWIKKRAEISKDLKSSGDTIDTSDQSKKSPRRKVSPQIN